MSKTNAKLAKDLTLNIAIEQMKKDQDEKVESGAWYGGYKFVLHTK